MAKFVLTTDSGCDLSLEALQSRDVPAMGICYELNGQIVEDTMKVEDCKKFYQGMVNGDAPKTSQLNTAQFLDFWEKVGERGLPIVHICLGSGISGTYANGLAAIEMLKEEKPELEIHLVDSTLASAAYGILVMQAADMRDSGATAQECEDWLNSVKANVNTYYTTSDLTYLYRGGRVSKAGMVVAHALNINPILNLDLEGHLIVQEKVRGKKATVKRIHDLIRETVIDPENQTLYISHSDIPEEAREFGEALKEDIGFKDVYYTYIGTTIGAHTGPGLKAAFYVGKPRTMKGYKGQ
jgi:DegV family protein with EDD domain